MKYLIVCLSLLCVGAAHAQTIPPEVAVPRGNRIIQRAYAKGVQIYVCTQDPADTNRFVWTFKEPEADLYADHDNRTKIGKHDLNADGQPTWTFVNGSKVSAVKKQQAPALDKTSIPWLLLRPTRTEGNGLLRRTTYIQRLFTKGGNPSAADANRANKGQTVRVPYTAEYLFYGPQ